MTMNLVVLTTTAMEMVQYSRDKLNRRSSPSSVEVSIGGVPRTWLKVGKATSYNSIAIAPLSVAGGGGGG